jgi:hypothetical protein
VRPSTSRRIYPGEPQRALSRIGTPSTHRGRPRTHRLFATSEYSEISEYSEFSLSRHTCHPASKIFHQKNLPIIHLFRNFATVNALRDYNVDRFGCLQPLEKMLK